jgi:hypothetical protein
MAAMALVSCGACSNSNTSNNDAAPPAASGQLIEVVDVRPAETNETHNQRWVAECKKIGADGTPSDQPLHFYFDNSVESFGDSAKSLAGRRFTVKIKRQVKDDVLEFEAVSDDKVTR